MAVSHVIFGTRLWYSVTHPRSETHMELARCVSICINLTTLGYQDPVVNSQHLRGLETINVRYGSGRGRKGKTTSTEVGYLYSGKEKRLSA